MDGEILAIQSTLEAIVVQRENERKEAHSQAMKDLADARSKEDQRQAKAKEDQRQATERAVQRKKIAQDAEHEKLRDEAHLRTIIEQEENRKLDEVERIVRLKEIIKRRLDDMEHAEEIAKKELRDLIMRAEPKDDSENISSNPLERFLQKSPE